MGYPTIAKFDVEFIKRTKANVKAAALPNTFTNLINSLVGLIFIPNEFHKKGKRAYKVNFMNKPISDYPELVTIFSGSAKLTSENGKVFNQLKFFYKVDSKSKTLDQTTVGDLVRLVRNGVAHSNITPVAEGNTWRGVIVRNFQSEEKEKKNNFNFETYLTQLELRVFATFIADQYLDNVK